MRIGIDIDDTITNSWKYLIPYYSQKFNIPITKLQKSKPYFNAISDVISLSDYDKILLPLYDTVMPDVPIKDDVKENIDKLYKLGHHVIFITARGNDYSDSYKLTKDYLDKHLIKYDKIITGCHNKAIICQKENIDLFIDDSIKHCTSVNKIGIEVLIMETDYNKDCHEFKRVKSWKEIYEYIKNRG